MKKLIWLALLLPTMTFAAEGDRTMLQAFWDLNCPAFNNQCYQTREILDQHDRIAALEDSLAPGFSVTYDFNDETTYPAGWFEINDGTNVINGGKVWVVVRSVRFTGAALGAALGYQVNLGSFTEATLKFSYRETGTWTATDKFEVQVSTDNQATWTTIYTLSDDWGDLWSEHEVDISGFAQTDVFFKFVNLGSTTTKQAYIDNVTISGK